MPHRESELVRSDSRPKQEFGDEADLPGGLPDAETAASMEGVFWLFSLLLRYPGEEVYLRLRENSRLLKQLLGDATFRAPELSDPQEVQAEYVRLMVNNYGQIPAVPYASCYLNEEGLLMESVHREIVQLMRGEGKEPKQDIGEPADHIYLLLEFCAEMAGAIRRKESGGRKYCAMRTVICRYIAPMAERFCQDLEKHARQDFYRSVALAFRDFIREMRPLWEGGCESVNTCEQEDSLCHPCL